jgi:hypothetical protein
LTSVASGGFLLTQVGSEERFFSSLTKELRGRKEGEKESFFL